jgi:hypothetical protein
MFFLFAVTTSGQSFETAQNAFPDPFAPQQVVAAIDNVAYKYTAFLDANLFAPAAQEFAFIGDNVGFVADNAGSQVLSFLGVESTPGVAEQQVAGAYTQEVVSEYYPVSSGAEIFSFLLGK